jgi:hypothetical protein
MADINNLIVYQESRELIRLIRPLTAGISFGDLNDQIRRAAISIVSNDNYDCRSTSIRIAGLIG